MGACVLRKIGPWVSSPKQSGTCIGIHIKANVHYDPCFFSPYLVYHIFQGIENGRSSYFLLILY